MKVLIVEDDRLIAKDIARALSAHGHTVAGFASSGEEAIPKVGALAPDLVLMDVNLGHGMDGTEAAQSIRKHHAIPIVFLTAFADPPTVRRATAASALGYVVKPFRDVDLNCAIEVALARHQAEATLRAREVIFRRLSHTDELTGLYNRRGFMMLARQQLRLSPRVQRSTAVFFADLDGLKRINDRLGHAAGTRAIKDTARALKETFRSPDIMARFGGDEFVVFGFMDANGARRALARLNDWLSRFNALPTREFELGLSVGMATCGADDNDTLEALLARADAAMYAEKASRTGFGRLAAPVGETKHETASTDADLGGHRDGNEHGPR